MTIIQGLQTNLLAAIILFSLSSSHLHAQENPAPEPKSTPIYHIVDAGLIIARAVDERPGLNAAGQVAAWTTVQRSSSQADLRHSDQTSAILSGLPSDSNSFAFGINSAGIVVGIIESAADMRFTHAFAWSAGNLHILPTLGGDYGVARSVNDSGLIAGAAQTPDRYFHATVWIAHIPKELATLPGGDTSYANDISRDGEVVGQSNDGPNRQAKAVRWTRSGRIHRLPTQPGSVFSSALAVNNQGQAVGFDNAQAVLWSRGREIELGNFGDDPNVALDINDRGDVVGSSAEDEGRMRAFIWKNGKLANLNNLIPANSGWVLLSAFRINNSGTILAHGFYQGKSRICLLSPTNYRPNHRPGHIGSGP